MKAKVIDKETLEELYIRQELTLTEVADILSMSKSTVHRKLIMHQIPIRGISQAKRGRSNGHQGKLKRELDKESIYKDYFDNNLSMRSICLKYKVAMDTLRKNFNNWGWEIRPKEVQSTMHNKLNKRGKNYGKQNKNYNYIYTKVAFSNYPPICCICGYKKHREALEVHHIDGDRSNNEVSNLRILCPTCHKEITLGLRENKFQEN